MNITMMTWLPAAKPYIQSTGPCWEAANRAEKRQGNGGSGGLEHRLRTWVPGVAGQGCRRAQAQQPVIPTRPAQRCRLPLHAALQLQNPLKDPLRTTTTEHALFTDFTLPLPGEPKNQHGGSSEGWVKSTNTTITFFQCFRLLFFLKKKSLSI